MQPPVGASSWSQYSNASPPSSYCARKGWKKIEEMAACPLERRLDSLSPPSLSLSSHLGPRRSSYVPHSHSFPPQSLCWCQWSASLWSKKELILSATNTPGVHTLSSDSSSSQIHPSQQTKPGHWVHCPNQPCFLWLNLFPCLPFLHVWACNLVI